MEEHGVFKPLDTTANPLDLCQFYCTNPEFSKVISGPKSLASVCKVKHLLGKAKDHGQLYITVVFEGGNVTPLGLLKELHLQYTLSCIPIFTPNEAKLGQKTRVCCYPICTYMKNDSVLLNYIIISHYWSNFACRKCLEFITSSGQQMKKHFLKCHGIKLQGSGEPSSKSKKDKGDKHSDEEKGNNPCGLESKSGCKMTSQEQAQESLHCSKHLAGSSVAGSSHQSHRKSKKCSKKLHKKSHH